MKKEKKKRCSSNHSPLPMCRPVDSQLTSKRKLTLPPRSSPFYCWAGHDMAWNTSLVSSGHLPGCISSQALVQPHSTCWGWIRNKEDLDTVHTHCSAIAKILVVCHQPCLVKNLRALYHLLWRIPPSHTTRWYHQKPQHRKEHTERPWKPISKRWWNQA